MMHAFETPVCECPTGYFGESCNIKDYPCPYDCNNHGTCNKQDGKCACDKGYSGLDCGANCSSDLNNCNGHGVCLGNRCACDSGYNGKDCSLKFAQREDHPCFNGIPYYMSEFIYSCYCLGGWIGPACNIKDIY